MRIQCGVRSAECGVRSNRHQIRKKQTLRIRTFLVSLMLLAAAAAPAWCDEAYYPERRKPQFQADPGYYVFPSPYSIPGIGAGGALIGLANNIAGTHTDAFVFLLYLFTTHLF